MGRVFKKWAEGVSEGGEGFEGGCAERGSNSGASTCA